jgi:hypothetical protein
MHHLDRRLAVDQDLAAAIDDEGGDVAFAFLAKAIGDALETDQADHRSDDAIARVLDRNRDDDGWLIHRGDVLQHPHRLIAGQSDLPRRVHVLQHFGLEIDRFGLRSLPGGVEHAQSDEIGIR